jgi:hypothetical protein
MADVVKLEKPFTMDGTNNYVLGDVGPRGGVMTVQLDGVTGTRSVVVKGRAKGATAWLAIPYRPLHLNGSAGDGVEVSTAITTHSLIQIPIADGVEVSLENTHTSGSMTVVAYPSS